MDSAAHGSPGSSVALTPGPGVRPPHVPLLQLLAFWLHPSFSPASGASLLFTLLSKPEELPVPPTAMIRLDGETRRLGSLAPPSKLRRPNKLPRLDRSQSPCCGFEILSFCFQSVTWLITMLLNYQYVW